MVNCEAVNFEALGRQDFRATNGQGTPNQPSAGFEGYVAYYRGYYIELAISDAKIGRIREYVQYEYRRVYDEVYSAEIAKLPKPT